MKNGFSFFNLSFFTLFLFLFSILFFSPFFSIFYSKDWSKPGVNHGFKSLMVAGEPLVTLSASDSALNASNNISSSLVYAINMQSGHSKTIPRLENKSRDRELLEIR